MKHCTRCCSRKRIALRLGILTGALIAVCGAGLLIGSVGISPADLFRALFSADRSDPVYRILVYVRLPRVLCATRERLRRLEEKQSSVEEKMEEIRLVNRAKWLLIEHLHMTEAQAHRYLEKKSMDTRLSRREVAQTVIRDYESPKAVGPNPKGEER